MGVNTKRYLEAADKVSEKVESIQEHDTIDQASVDPLAGQLLNCNPLIRHPVNFILRPPPIL